jgi:polyferredoxin
VLAWFVVLVPLTYFLGRVWCGWLCHLGALQEFLHRKGIVPELGPSAVRGLRWVRRVVLAALLVQLLVARRNLWEANDPFRAVFNLMVPDAWLGWALLVALLVSSLLVYRPFCRTVCPVGLVLGWIGSLPGAARLRPTTDCTSCSVCQKRCPNGAIGDDSAPVPESCIACGECVVACRQDALSWRKREPQESHPSSSLQESGEVTAG